MTMTVDLAGKVAVVTGGAGNLGRAVVESFFRSGARVAVVDRDADRARQAFAGVVPEGDHCMMVAADLLDEASVSRMVAAVVERFGSIDILANLAGGFASAGPVQDAGQPDFDHMFNLNARTVFIVSRAVIPVMLQQGRGKIVNVGAKAALSGSANSGLFVASKMAVIRLTESMSADLKNKGINVNVVLPSTIDTPANRQDMPKADPAKWVTAASLANVILFLASDASDDINGASIPVYGRS